MTTLSYVNVFTHDLQKLPDFYMTLFGFTEVEEMRSPIFRGIRAGDCKIGFNAQDAYGLLKLDAFAAPTGVKFLLNFDVDSRADVDRITPLAIEQGATLVKPPYDTYYHWYQSVLFDPEGNVFRINYAGG